jgi:two-component system nitrate/nitrite response regulator NarL
MQQTGAPSGGRVPAAARSGSPARAMRVLVCSEIRLYREGLASVLERTDGLEVVGTAASPEDCIGDVASTAAEVVLLDAARSDPQRTVRALRTVAPATRVVVLAAPEGESELMALAEAGVAAFVTRDDALSDLVEVLGGVRRGEVRCSPRTAGMLLRRVTALAAERSSAVGAGDRHERLTRRELEILALVADGLSNKQIGARLQIELATVKNHVHHILEKLEVERRSQAVALVRANGLLGDVAV